MSSDAESSESSDEGESPTITIDSDDDDELKQAKEMALAIAQNPHLTAEQIQEMVKSRQVRAKYVWRSRDSLGRHCSAGVVDAGGLAAGQRRRVARGRFG